MATLSQGSANDLEVAHMIAFHASDDERFVKGVRLWPASIE
jgi:hypothetical protein